MSESRIDRDKAIRIAKRAAADRGWPLLEPIYAVEREVDFLVSTNAEFLGGTVVVVIDRETGEIRSIDHYTR